jgi:hypothetical protein
MRLMPFNLQDRACVGRVLLVVAHRQATYVPRREHLRQRDLEVVVHFGKVPPDVPLNRYDVLALDLSPDPFSATGFGARCLRDDPALALVFFCQDATSPEVAAFLALGVGPVIVGPRGRDWFVEAAPALARAARLRRSLREVEAQIPTAPVEASNVRQVQRPLPLPVAERRFREAYLRTLVAAAPNRADAAALAGISYRSACRILHDYSVTPPPASARPPGFTDSRASPRRTQSQK